MSGRVATVAIDPATVAQASGDYDIWELVPADDRPIALVGLLVYTTSELAEAQEEWLSLAVITDNTTSSNGSAATPRPIDPRDSVGFSAETLGATIATGGTAITVVRMAFQVRNGYEMWFPDLCAPRCDQADTAMYIRLTAAVTDDVTLTGTAFVMEA